MELSSTNMLNACPILVAITTGALTGAKLPQVVYRRNK